MPDTQENLDELLRRRIKALAGEFAKGRRRGQKPIIGLEREIGELLKLTGPFKYEARHVSQTVNAMAEGRINDNSFYLTVREDLERRGLL